MRLSTRPRTFICTRCIFTFRRSLVSATVFSTNDDQSSIPLPIATVDSLPIIPLTRVKSLTLRKIPYEPPQVGYEKDDLRSKTSRQIEVTSTSFKKIRKIRAAISKYPSKSKISPPLLLSPLQRGILKGFADFKSRLETHLSQYAAANGQGAGSLRLEDALHGLHIPPGLKNAHELLVLKRIQKLYAGQHISQVLDDLETATADSWQSADPSQTESSLKLLGKLGIIQPPSKLNEEFVPSADQISGRQQSRTNLRLPNTRTRNSTQSIRRARAINSDAKLATVKRDISASGRNGPTARDVDNQGDSPLPRKKLVDPNHPLQLRAEHTRDIVAGKLEIQPLHVGKLNVPGLSFDLSRVLFNEGVYQLQDPRSGVFNFDPYLQNIMPVSEFDFDLLREYITSSEDVVLHQLAKENGKKYVGSSSSMNGPLTQFHLLLSQYRQLNISSLSRGFGSPSSLLSAFHKTPMAVFLRHKDGVYAVDADKEFDEENILMSLGHSMEKLLTLPKREFERFRKSGEAVSKSKKPTDRESYHYCHQANFLLRSQLDAHDPRLPGTGMFDLKTRAVLSIRMQPGDHENGLGYQIKSRLGDLESYEREYYDMIRSAFLKYSLQVRMGRMDGIFVAYHNIERIFGFQYIPLSQLDLHIHGQEDPTLGDQEFKLSVQLLNEIFDRATEKFPGRSLRFHFDAVGSESQISGSHLHVFAEPVDEGEITRIQKSRVAVVKEIRKTLFSSPSDIVPNTIEDLMASSNTSPLKEQTISEALSETEAGLYVAGMKPESSLSQDTDSDPMTVQDTDKPVLALRLKIRNWVNGTLVPRPEELHKEDEWNVKYEIEELDSSVVGRLYQLCLLQRKRAGSNRKTHGSIHSPFMRELKRLCLQGAEWRRWQDKHASGREPVVLYPDKL